MSDELSKKRARTRSPAYPSICLEAAIERAQVIYRNENRNAAHVDVIIGHWGYEQGSSNGLRAIAALKQFGLLEEEGKKENRQVRLSRLALDILIPHEDGDPSQRQAIREAALRPPLHCEIWDKYKGQLPSDAALRRYLLIDRNFNDAAVDPFIRQFRETVAFADLPNEDIIMAGEDDEMERKPGWGEKMAGPTQDTSLAKDKTPPKGAGAAWPTDGPYISFPLRGGNVMEIRLRSRVSRKDFERIKTLLDLSEDSLVQENEFDGQTDQG